MKNIILSLVILATLISCEKKETHYVEVNTYSSGPLKRGDEVGNGGDNITVHFKAAIYDVIQLLEKDHNIDLDVNRLKELVSGEKQERLIVVATDETLLDKNGHRKEALNYPHGKLYSVKPQINLSKQDMGQPLIVLNKAAWNQHVNNKIDLSLLVFHELAPILGKLDDDGKLSESFKKLISERNREDSQRARGNRVETMLPDSESITSILVDRDLVEGILDLDKRVREKLGLDKVLGEFVFDVHVYNVNRLRGYYRIFRNKKHFTKTLTYAYPVELETGENRLILEIKKEEFQSAKLKTRILDSFVAMVYLRDDLMSVLEMEEVIKAAIEITENLLPLKSLL